MKKILFIALIAASFSSTVFADRDRLERRQDYQYRPHPDARWHSDAGWLISAWVHAAIENCHLHTLRTNSR
jgi:hypothetical protein